jgi:2-(1,2-epoxy-1,2-dihydrophenyl)acetyl-CoA isomerase
MDYENLRLAIAGGIVTLTLDRPDSLNALSQQALVELRHALKSVTASTEARCLVLTGSGRGFCTGVDLNAPRAVDPNDPDEFLRDYFVPPFRLLANLQIPTIAAVNGPCAGAGMSLALTCDIVLAIESAYFLQPFVNIGLVPDLGSSWLLPHSVGRARAAGLMLLGEKLPAAQAAEWGLIWKCVAADRFQPELDAITAKFVNGASSHGRIKQLLQQAFRNDLPAQMQLELEYQGAAIRSADHQEARLAFREKRPPVFTRSGTP